MAIFVSLAGAVIEMGVRVFYFILFQNVGLRKDGYWEDGELLAYAVRAKMRVADASNDMIVEYLSSITAGLFLAELGGTDAFSFASDAAIDPDRVWTLVLFHGG